MKKYIIGTLFGFALAFSITAHGEAINLIDKVVQGMFPVTVDGVSMGDAIVVENKTYLPVREFGEAIGYKVSFTDDREVILTKNEPVPTLPVATTQPLSTPEPNKINVQHFSKTKSNIEKENDMHNGMFFLAEVDGNQYVSIISLSKIFDVTWNGPTSTATFKRTGFDDKNITISKVYSKDTDGFVQSGVSLFKLSLLGLKATAADGTLIIEKQ
jgi:hypothetical protein